MNIGYGGEDCMLSGSFSLGQEKEGVRFANAASIWRPQDKQVNSDPTQEYGIIRRTLSNSITSSVRTLERTPLKYLAFVMVLSWLAAAYSTVGIPGTISDLEHRIMLQRRMVDDSRQALKSLQDHVAEEKNFVKNLEVTHEALAHEVRLMDEFSDAEYDVTPLRPDHEGTEMVRAWLEHRQEGLEKRLMQLERYVQYFSRREAVRRFGTGPHFIRITVEMPVLNKSAHGDESAQSGLQLRSFVVQMAPLDDMPHSVYFFLEMVQLRMWDNTFFYHHEKSEHVISALPLNYQSGSLTFQNLSFLGRQSLSFPEYSMEHQHERYTLGFANVGPSFYLNTRNNVDVHGPGGQGHHLLPLDADPCFGRVVDGEPVVDDLIQLGLLFDEGGGSSDTDEGTTEGGTAPVAAAHFGSHPGMQFETRIVSINIDEDYRLRTGSV